MGARLSVAVLSSAVVGGNLRLERSATGELSVLGSRDSTAGKHAEQ